MTTSVRRSRWCSSNDIDILQHFLLFQLYHTVITTRVSLKKLAWCSKKTGSWTNWEQPVFTRSSARFLPPWHPSPYLFYRIPKHVCEISRRGRGWPRERCHGMKFVRLHRGLSIRISGSECDSIELNAGPRFPIFIHGCFWYACRSLISCM